MILQISVKKNKKLNYYFKLEFSVIIFHRSSLIQSNLKKINFYLLNIYCFNFYFYNTLILIFNFIISNTTKYIYIMI